MNREIMQRFEKQPVVMPFLAATRQTTPKNIQRDLPISLRHLRRHADLPNRSASYESLKTGFGNPSRLSLRQSVHTA
jgi:hypothetical protein